MNKHFNVNLLIGKNFGEMELKYNIDYTDNVVLIERVKTSNVVNILACGVEEICSTLRSVKNLKDLFIIREESNGIDISVLSMRTFSKKYDCAQTHSIYGYNEALKSKACNAQLARA